MLSHSHRSFLVLLLVGLALAVSLSWNAGAQNDDDDSDGQDAAPVFPAPCGLSVSAGSGVLHVAWSRGPGTNVPLAGYAVYYWETQQPGWEWERVRVLDATRTTITGLRPDVEYTVAVCAGTRQLLPGRHRRFGDWLLSDFSDHVSATSLADYRLHLFGGFLARGARPARAIIDVSRQRPGTDEWVTRRFHVDEGDRIGEPVEVGNLGFVDFGTPWQLDAVETVVNHRDVIGMERSVTVTDAAGVELTDTLGNPLALPFPKRSEQPRVGAIQARISARPLFPGGDRRTRVLIVGE